MGRPLKTTVEFFSHDCKHGKTIFILQQQFKNDGYAFWYKLLELLGDSSGHTYNCNDISSWQYLIAYTMVSEDTAIKILNILASLEKIDRELWGNKIIWCQNFVDRLTDVYDKRDSPLPVKPNSNTPPLIANINLVSVTEMPVNPQKNKINIVNDNINPQSRVEYSKVKDIDILSVFNFWNEQNIVVHKNCNGNESIIKKLLKTYTVEEIKQSIKNYEEILHSENYYWSYTWTLKEFLKRGIDKFIDIEIARKNYAKSLKNSKGVKSGQTTKGNPWGNSAN